MANLRILVTGAEEVIGRAVVGHLIARGAETVAVVNRAEAQEAVERLGATPIVGDLRDRTVLRRAMAGVDRVYHICPAWSADEHAIGEAVIAAAQAADISLFGYHSALPPHLEDVPSHWDKVQVQMALMRSGLPFSVIQPAATMQDLIAGWAWQGDTCELVVPYRTDMPLSWVDAEDVGAAVARLMTRPNQRGGTYELCGTGAPVTVSEIAATLGRELGRPIAARARPPDELAGAPPHNDLDGERLARFAAYCRFIDAFGLRAGNTRVLRMLLGRPPTTWQAFARRTGVPV